MHKNIFCVCVLLFSILQCTLAWIPFPNNNCFQIICLGAINHTGPRIEDLNGRHSLSSNPQEHGAMDGQGICNMSFQGINKTEAAHSSHHYIYIFIYLFIFFIFICFSDVWNLFKKHGKARCVFWGGNASKLLRSCLQEATQRNTRLGYTGPAVVDVGNKTSNWLVWRKNLSSFDPQN